MRRTTAAGRPAPKAYHHGDLRRALLDEALATIRAGGVDQLTLREIGARLGVSRTALYRHFTDKRALLVAVATEGFRMLREALASAWEDGGRGREAFDEMGRVYIRFALANPSHYRVMFGGSVAPLTDTELKAEGDGAFGVLVEAIRTLQASRRVRRDDAVTAAMFVWAVVHGVAMLGIDGKLQEPAVEALMPYALERLFTGIEAEPARRRR